MNQATRQGLRGLFLVALVGMVFFLRMPSYGNVFCDPDQGTSAYTAMLMLDGRCPYADAVISKPPGTILLYALSFFLFGYQMLAVHLMAAAWSAASVLLLYFLGRRALDPRAGLAAAGLYAFYQADIMAAGPCANFEFWTILPALACLLLIGEPPAGRKRLFGAGAVACLAVAMKQPAILFALAGAILVCGQTIAAAQNHKLRAAMRRLFWYAAGGAAGAALVVATMAAVSCVGPMAAEFNPLRLGEYFSSFAPEARRAFAAQQWRRFFFSNQVLLAWLALAIGATALLPRLRPLLKVYRGPALFLLAALGAVCAGGHFFGHYFALLPPFAALIVGLFFGGIARRGHRGVTVLAAALLIGGTLVDSLPEIRLASASTAGLLRNGSVLTASICEANRQRKIEPGSKTELINRLEWQPTLRQVVDYLRANLQPGQTVWSYDYFDEVYFFTRTFAPTRHQENFELVTSSKQISYGLWHSSLDDEVRRNRAEVMADLRRHPPQFIVRQTFDCLEPDNPTGREIPGWPVNVYGRPMAECIAKMELFPELAEFLAARYQLVEPPVNPDIDLFRLRENE